MKNKDFLTNNRKYILLLVLLFVGINFYGQDECFKVFRDESIKEFKKTNYQKAIDNLKVASSCEDKPKKNDIYDLIEKYQNCINYKSQANNLFGENNYEIALYFFKQLASLNPEDSYAKAKIIECKDKLSCFPEVRNKGNIAFRKSKYNDALQYFVQAQECSVQPTYNDLELLTDNVRQCIYFRGRADSLLAAKDYKSAIENYTNVLTLNPFDNYCREQMKTIPSEFEQFIEKPINKGWFFTINYSYRNVAPFYNNKSFKTGDGFIGITGGKMNNWGYYGNLMIGSSSLWGLKNYTSSKYLNETGDEIYSVFKGGEYIASVEDRMYLTEGEVLIHKYPSYTRHTNVSFSAGITKRIINNAKFKMHLTAGIGWANWGAEQELYRNSSRSNVVLDEPQIYFKQDVNSDFATFQVDEYWIEFPSNAFYYNFKN